MKVINTKVFFSALLQGGGADCICDIGSRDGSDSLRFRAVFPTARILAFEANHINVERMKADPRLTEAKIEILPIAVSNAEGEATFNITKVSSNDPGDVSGTSSLLQHGGLEVQEVAVVKTQRLDQLLPERVPNFQGIGAWIDVEGAEYLVIEGMEGIRDRVIALHIETANRAMREGQKTTAELTALLDRMGFDFAGANFGPDDLWGDAVYVNRAVRAKLGPLYDRYWRKARASVIFRIGSIGGFLQRRMPWLYRFAYRLWYRAKGKAA